MQRSIHSTVLIVLLALNSVNVAYAIEEERLHLPPIQGWGQWKVLTEQRSPERIFVERIPETQSFNEIRDIVIEQYYVGLQRKISPVDLLRSLPRLAKTTNCEQIRATTPVEGIERGYKVAYAQMYCPKQKDKEYGFIDLQKVIQGSNGLYIIQREWRINAFDFQNSANSKSTFIPQEAFGSMDNAKAWFKELEISNEYLIKNVYVCTPSETANSCP